jgi:hypothetical protein
VGLTDLLDDVPEAILAGLPDPQRAALDVIRRRRTAEAIDGLAVRLALLGVLRLLSAERPVVVVVDDGGWLDQESAAALEFAARRRGTDDWTVLVTAHTDAADAALALLPQPSYRVELPPLDAEAIGALVRNRLGTVLLPATKRALVEGCGGNPLLALEMAHALSRSNRVGDHASGLPVPLQLREVLRARLAGLSPSARLVLLGAASLQRPGVAVLTKAFADAEEHLVASEIAEVRDGMVLMRHPLVASVLLADASPEERRDVHARLAAAMSDPVEQARHLALADPLPSERLASILEEAAELAHSRGAAASASELWSLAVARTPLSAASTRRRRLLATAQACLVVGEFTRATAAAQAVIDDVADGPERAAALLMLAKLQGQEVPGVQPMLDEALLHAAGDAELVASIRYWRGLVAFVGGLPELAEAELSAAVEAARAAPGPHLVSALGLLALTQTLRGRSARSLLDEATAWES